ncbi:MAG TPA: ATP-binding cassette domain-containing protein [Candidatus Acidoferrales bacterium]|nr:ATP-binding cassette domain-containing protein [Candidatus Acidoferrales bacterium]
MTQRRQRHRSRLPADRNRSLPPARRRAHRSAGVLSESVGRTNLEVLARLSGQGGSRVNEMLETVDLSARAGDRVGTYSLGMKQRLGVAMALLPDPELLVLDEPANGLDPLGTIAMRELLRGLRDQGKTIVLSSHLLGELEHLADWLVMLHEGKALFCGSAKDLLAQETSLEQLFLALVKGERS